MKRICKIFGHSWKYYFSPKDSLNEIAHIRKCRRCNIVQNYRRAITMTLPGGFEWRTMIGFTKLGAKDFWENKLT